ncbi:hypothetical protein CKA32_005814 [Geitlerinema sp. FC II]|nr:hypothetical protein CKA32_005814 [Geitlerinema sp. FC II]
MGLQAIEIDNIREIHSLAYVILLNLASVKLQLTDILNTIYDDRYINKQ